MKFQWTCYKKIAISWVVYSILVHIIMNVIEKKYIFEKKNSPYTYYYNMRTCLFNIFFN